LRLFPCLRMALPSRRTRLHVVAGKRACSRSGALVRHIYAALIECLRVETILQIWVQREVIKAAGLALVTTSMYRGETPLSSRFLNRLASFAICGKVLLHKIPSLHHGTAN
jgi:hypothetical protein